MGNVITYDVIEQPHAFEVINERYQYNDMVRCARYAVGLSNAIYINKLATFFRAS